MVRYAGFRHSCNVVLSFFFLKLSVCPIIQLVIQVGCRIPQANGAQKLSPTVVINTQNSACCYCVCVIHSALNKNKAFQFNSLSSHISL